jgi:glycosyltransferase involved in cell wall biosynthesis
MAVQDSAPARLDRSVSLVLPAYNEEANLRPVVDAALTTLPRHFRQFEIIVVDDGSSDGTPAVADQLAAAHPSVRIVHHPRNRGYGAALSSGFAASTGELIMFMDADRQFDIADISRLMPFVDTHDIVAGFRMERNDDLHRRVFAETFNVAIRVVFGVHMRDIDCAFKIFDGDLLRSIAITSNGALINTEIIAKARRQGSQIQQVGVQHYPRTAGTSTGGNPKVILRAMRDTPRLWWHMRSYEPPPGRPNREGRHRLARGVVDGAGEVVAGLTGFTRSRSNDS